MKNTGSSIDLRESLNAISDVVANRPKPLREFDQIFMKSADMLLQTEHVGRWFDDKEVVFIGDGDAIGLCLIYLYHSDILAFGPKKVTVLDFDERVVFSVLRFAEEKGLSDFISAELYNVADPLPEKFWGKFGGFYTNPPFGKSNGGKSVEAFLRRGVEAVGDHSHGCIVIADHPDYSWTQDVLQATQQSVIEKGFLISELIPKFHLYHLDDSPDLTSCSMIIRRVASASVVYNSDPLPQDSLANFYGKSSPLKAHYVRDKTRGGRLSSQDHVVEPFTHA